MQCYRSNQLSGSQLKMREWKSMDICWDSIVFNQNIRKYSGTWPHAYSLRSVVK